MLFKRLATHTELRRNADFHTKKEWLSGIGAHDRYPIDTYKASCLSSLIYSHATHTLGKDVWPRCYAWLCNSTSNNECSNA